MKRFLVRFLISGSIIHIELYSILVFYPLVLGFTAVNSILAGYTVGGDAEQ